jgi:hypothetical protein
MQRDSLAANGPVWVTLNNFAVVMTGFRAAARVANYR